MSDGIPAESKNGHEWGYWIPDVVWQSCRICGVVRRRDDRNGKCKGPHKVGPLAASKRKSGKRS